MKICWLTTDAYGKLGGIAQYNRDFLRAVTHYDRCGEIIVLPRLVTDAVGDLPKKITWLENGKNSKIKYCLTILRQLLSSTKINLVICAHINLLPLAYLVSFWHRVPLVLISYGIDVWQPTNHPITNFLVSKVDMLISISQITLDKLMSWSKASRGRTFIIPNAIDLTQFFPGSKDAKLLARYGLEGRTIIATMGRMVSIERYKGMDELIELIPALKKLIPNLSYLLIGDGADRYRLERKARALGVDANIVFTGRIPDDERLAHYRLADTYVMPSRGEGFGFVFLEAMASGVPVVASKIDGGREAVRGGKLGGLVDPDDPDDIKRGIVDSLKQPRGVRPEGLDYFSYENFQKRVHEFLDCALDGK